LYYKKKKKKKKSTTEAPRRLRTPRKEDGEMFALAIKMHGTDQVKAICEDGIERGCRITGKMKIIKIWDFQPIKADIVWRYLGGQKNTLEKNGYLKGLGF